MSEKIRQWFCRHEWKSLGNVRWYEADDFGTPAQYICDDFECVKCGKKKTESVKCPRYCD